MENLNIISFWLLQHRINENNLLRDLMYFNNCYLDLKIKTIQYRGNIMKLPRHLSF